MSTAADRLWTQAQVSLKTVLGRRAYKLWFAEVRPLRVKGKSITVEVPTDFHAAYIREHYLETVELVLLVEHAREIKIRLEVSKEQGRMPTQLTYFHQRLAYLRAVVRKERYRLTDDAKHFLAEIFHRSASELDQALFMLPFFSSRAGPPLTARAVRSHLASLIDAVQGPKIPVWLAPK